MIFFFFFFQCGPQLHHLVSHHAASCAQHCGLKARENKAAIEASRAAGRAPLPTGRFSVGIRLHHSIPEQASATPSSPIREHTAHQPACRCNDITVTLPSLQQSTTGERGARKFKLTDGLSHSDCKFKLSLCYMSSVTSSGVNGILIQNVQRVPDLRR